METLVLDQNELQQQNTEDNIPNPPQDQSEIEEENQNPPPDESEDGEDSDDEFLDDKLTPLKEGLSQFLSELDNAINTVVFANSLPLVGNKLQNVTESPLNFATAVRDKLNSALEVLEDNPTSEVIQEALFDALGPDGLNFIKDANEDDQVDLNDITIEETVENLEISFKLGNNSDDLFDVNFGENLGIPGLNIYLEGGAQAKLDFEFDVSFGVEVTDDITNPFEFYVNTEDEDELTFDLKVLTPDLEAEGTLGFLKVAVTDEDADDNSENDGEDADGDGINPTQLNSTFSVNIQDSDEDNKLTSAEIPSLISGDLIDSSFTGSTDINLNLKTSFGDSVKFPAIGTDFNVAWEFDQTGAGSPNIAFNNVEIDIGKFLSSFAAPILEATQTVTDTFPLNKIADVLTRDINVGFTRINLLNFAETFGKVTPETREFIEVVAKIADIINIINDIPTDGENATVSLGDFVITGNNPIENSIQSQSLLLSEPNNLTLFNSNSTADFLEENTSNQLKTNSPSVESLDQSQNELFELITNEPRLDFPILTNPEETIPALLLGQVVGTQPVDLFTLDLPTLGLGFIYESPEIPIFGPLTIQIDGKVGAAASISFGYDTYGLQQFQETGFSDPSVISQGLYVSSNEQPEAPEPLDPNRPFIGGVGAGVAADVGLSLGIIRASVDAGIASNLYLDLAEPRTRIQDFSDPGCLFEVEGAFDVIIGASLRIGFGIFSIRKRIELFRETLADFRAGCSDSEDNEDQGQAVVVENKLELETSKDNDALIIDHVGGTSANETVDVTAYTVEEVIEDNKPQKELLSYKDAFSYTNFNIITGDGKGGRDRIEIGDGVLSPASLKGGNQDDELLGGQGDDTLDGGNDDDALFGGKGNDSLYGSNGSDFLEGGKGRDTLNGGGGFDAISYAAATNAVNINLIEESVTDGDGSEDVLIDIEQIDGSAFNDTIIADEDRNVIDGLEGNDFIFGGDKDDFIVGGAGADTLDGGDEDDGDGTSYLNSMAPVIIDLQNGLAFSGDAEGDWLISIEHILGTGYDDRLIGNDKKNHLNGSYGSDTLKGNAGNDTLEGEFGNDTLFGGEGKDTLDGGGYQNESPGQDWASYIQSSEGVEVSLKTGQGSGGDAEGDRLAHAKLYVSIENPDEVPELEDTEYNSIENLEGSVHNDVLQGDLGQNILKGLRGDDEIKAEEGNDTLEGGAGADTLDGGGSLDWADYSNSSDKVFVYLNLGFGLNGDAEGDQFEEDDGKSSIENLLGSDFDDVLVGDSGNNIINPGLGNGTDIVNGLEGSDRLIIDYSLRDTGTGITGGFESLNSGEISRNTIDNNTILDAVSFSEIEHLELIGTIKNDQVYSGSGNDILLPGAGDDTIYGGQGSNIILADAGNDFIVDQNNINRNFEGTPGDNLINLDGGSGIDTLSIDLSGKTENIILQSSNPFQQNSNQFFASADGTASITNFEVFKDIETGAGNDRLTQLRRVDNIFKTGAGADIVNPGLGFDQVDGGSGSSTLLSLPTLFATSSNLGVSLNFTTLEGVSGDPDNPLTAVYRADLSDLDFDINSIIITDDGSPLGGGTGAFSGFDLDGIKISNTLINQAEEVNEISGLDVFDFSPSGTFLTPGTQRPPIDPGNSEVASDLFGTFNGTIDNTIATLTMFDAENVFSSSDAMGFASLGDQGQVGFNFTDTILQTDEPLYLYIGEAGNNEQVPDGQIFISDTIIIPLAPNEDLLVLDFSVEDTGTGVFYTAEGTPQTFENLNPDFEILPELADENASNNGIFTRETTDEVSLLDQVNFTNFERFNITGTSQDDGLAGGDSHDILIANTGNDILIGNHGSDILNGGDGDDILVSTSSSGNTFEIDTVTGGAGGDHFWLGTTSCSYTDKNSETPDTWDYALIKDFNPTEGDVIHLAIASSNAINKGYSLEVSPSGLPLGTAIYRMGELVGIIEGVTDLNLSEDYFSFYSSSCAVLI